MKEWKNDKETWQLFGAYIMMLIILTLCGMHC